MLLPSIINEAHDSLVRAYLTSKKTDPRSSLKKQQWLMKADGSVIPVRLTIMTRVNYFERIQLIAFVDKIQ
jgi:plasmid rolling circle replication initiator protein Rep